MSLSLRLAVTGSIALLLPSQALARWSHSEADRKDRFSRLGTEYYNDKLSYRAPSAYDDLWDSHSLGFWALAGSLNQKQFVYSEHIKLRSEASAAWQLGLEAERTETPNDLENESETVLELSYGHEGGYWRIGLLAEAHTEKAYNDLGLLFSGRPWEGFRFALRLWAIDPFYESKKLEKKDSRAGGSSAYELSLIQVLGKLSLQLLVSTDRPATWTRDFQQQVYAFREDQISPRVTFKDGDSAVYIKGDWEKQSESFRSLSTTLKEGASHRSQIWETGYRRSRGDREDAVALWALNDRTIYEGASPLYPPEQPTLSQRSRREWALIGTRHQPLAASSRHRQHFGFTANQLEIRELKRKRSTEVKIQWTLDLELNRHSRFALGSSWDVDQLVTDLEKRSATPAWGGGYAHLLATF